MTCWVEWKKPLREEGKVSEDSHFSFIQSNRELPLLVFGSITDAHAGPIGSGCFGGSSQSQSCTGCRACPLTPFCLFVCFQTHLEVLHPELFLVHVSEAPTVGRPFLVFLGEFCAIAGKLRSPVVYSICQPPEPSLCS